MKGSASHLLWIFGLFSLGRETGKLIAIETQPLKNVAWPGSLAYHTPASAHTTSESISESSEKGNRPPRKGEKVIGEVKDQGEAA